MEYGLEIHIGWGGENKELLNAVLDEGIGAVFQPLRSNLNYEIYGFFGFYSDCNERIRPSYNGNFGLNRKGK